MSKDKSELETIFLEALDFVSGSERAGFLDRRCGNNAQLRAQVEELLKANADMSQFLNETHPLVEDSFESDDIGSQIGKYKLMEQIGEGGMGMVYVARQEVPVERDVALKIIKPGMDTREVLARFEQERQALAMMDHPNIAKVLDAGATTEGRPYFVMELVRGVPITQFCDDAQLTNSHRLKLFVDVCNAIQHAHQKGVIHRDIKPANVMVASFDGRAVVKVIDFGVAKAMGKSLTEKTVYTQFNQLIGTPMYMSPEQAELSGLDIDTRTDIYSLGVLLYELLTGTPPFDRERFKKAAFDEMRRIVREEEPPRPSRKVGGMGAAATTVSENRKTSLKRLTQSLHDDIDWIVMKSLEKDRSRRYETANAFAMDIDRFLSCQPVMAGPPSMAYRSRKFIERNSKSLTGLLLAMLLVAISCVLWVRNMNATYANGLRESLLAAQIEELPRIIDEMENYRMWIDGPLAHLIGDPKLEPSKKLRASLALLANDPQQVDFLKSQLVNADAAEFTVIRDCLIPYQDQLIEQLWVRVDKNDDEPKQSFAAACALASFDSKNERWNNQTFCEQLVDQLLVVLPSELEDWRRALTPVKENLIPSLKRCYVDKEFPEAKRLFATTTLAEYATGNPELLFDLMVEGDESQFELMFGKISGHRERAVELGGQELKSDLATASRKANAAVMLALMQEEDRIWRLLKHSPNPTTRSYLVHRLSSLGVDSAKVLSRFETETDASIRSALILSLGEFDEKALDSDSRKLFSKKLLSIYQTAKDVGLHGAAEWLLRKWGYQNEISKIDNDLQLSEEQIATCNKDWFVNKLGHSFAIVEAGQFEMGSKPGEPGHREEEVLHQRRINRRFAIGTKEITKAQWREFHNENKTVFDADNPQLKKLLPNDESPMAAIMYYEAAHYCNWLSEKAGISEDQWCYIKNNLDAYSPGMRAKDNFLELTGYRLPTEPEWEFACNANATTGRYYGEPDELLDHYAWYLNNANSHARDIGLKKPNDFGLFDMLGNVFERCYDRYDDYPVKEGEVLEDRPDNYEIHESRSFVLRGGSFNYFGQYARSAYRISYSPSNRISNYGFRVARTMPSNNSNESSKKDAE